MLLFTISYIIHVIIAKRRIPGIAGCAVCAVSHREHHMLGSAEAA